MSKDKKIIEEILALAGIAINGGKPHDIKVLNENLYSRVLKGGTLALGEAYMDGWWEVDQLDEFFHKVIKANLKDKVKFNLTTLLAFLRSRLINLQTHQGSKKVAQQHYDLSTEMYMSFLDPYNQYTCGYFKDTQDLNKAQEQKLRLICEKLELKKGDKVLDIGCGWGGFSKFASENYGCQVTGITISKEQAHFAREFTKGLSVDIKELDYRDLNEKFDKILICGMIEHVGFKNYRTIFKKVRDSLNEDGLFLLHTIANRRSVTSTDPWIEKYIFPNSMAPSAKQLTKASEGLFILEDLHNFGAYYDPTLMAWFDNFNKSWDKLKDKYDERFYRMWKYYLLSCAGAFRARELQLYQFVFSPKGRKGGYRSIR